MRETSVTTLANGMRVVTDRMTDVETASVGVWVGAGARSESTEVCGVAHMLEHMAFKGTARRDARRIAEDIEAVGGILNAHTAREHTAYYAKVLKQDLELAVDILADILQNSVFEETQLGRERTVVLQEIGQMLDTPDEIIFDHFQSAAYPDQPLGRPVLGSADVVRRMRRDMLVGYLGQHYRAGDTVLSVAGSVDHDAFVELAASAFAGFPAGKGTGSEPATYRGGEFRERRDLEQVHLVLGFQGVAIDHPEFYTAVLLSSLLGGGMSSRLFQELRERRGLVYSIYAFASSYSDDGLFGVYAGSGESEVGELIPVLCDQLGRLAHSLGEDEVAKARMQLKASLLMGLESTGARCEQNAQQLLVFGRLVPTEELVAAIDRVDGAAVSNLAHRLFSSRPTLASIGPVSRLEPFDAVVRRFTG